MNKDNTKVLTAKDYMKKAVQTIVREDNNWIINSNKKYHTGLNLVDDKTIINIVNNSANKEEIQKALAIVGKLIYKAYNEQKKEYYVKKKQYYQDRLDNIDNTTYHVCTAPTSNYIDQESQIDKYLDDKGIGTRNDKEYYITVDDKKGGE